MSQLKNTAAALAVAAAIALPAAAQALTVEVYGGIVGDGNITYGGSDYAMERGPLVGASIYVDGPIAGLSYGGDLMTTSAQYRGYPDEYATSRSLMGVVRYERGLTDSITAYGGLGLGLVQGTYDDTGTKYRDTEAGGQASLGLRFTLANGTQLFGEVKAQRAFKAVYVGGTAQEASSHGLIFGYRQSF